MTKYNQSFKQQVIEFYLQNGKDRSLTRQHFQIKETTFHHWLAQYHHNGFNGFAVSYTKQIYSPEFKLSVVQAVKNGVFSTTKATLYCGIPAPALISQWLQAFDKQGINGFSHPQRESVNETEIPENPPHRKPKKNACVIVFTDKVNKNAEIEQKIADNLLARNFHATKPNEKWVTDVSEFKCTQGLYPTKVDSIRWLIDFREIYQRNGISQSMSRKGIAWIIVQWKVFSGD